MEFVPTPAESRALVAAAYRVPFTMLVQFENDAIDETPEMAAILSSGNPAGAALPGTPPTLSRLCLLAPVMGVEESGDCSSVMRMSLAKYHLK